MSRVALVVLSVAIAWAGVGNTVVRNPDPLSVAASLALVAAWVVAYIALYRACES